MARIRRIHEIINGKLPSYNSAFIKVRGLAFPLDIFLKGRARFSRKLGAQLSIWVPENATTLAAFLSVTQTKASLTDLIPWLVPGSKVRLNNQLFAFVEDVVDNGYGVLLAESPLVNIPMDAPFELYGHPLEINATYPGTSEDPITFLSIISDHKIYLTDAINVGSFDYEVTESLLVQTLPDGRFQYQLTVSHGIPHHLDVGRTDQAYLRAHPAYESLPLTVPTTSGTVITNIGPFLFDRVSGPFYTDMNVEETDIVTLYDNMGGIISTSILGKNELVSGISISADCFLFWDKVRGKMQWDGNRQAYQSITDSAGVSHIHYQCVPTIKPGQLTSWRCLIETTVETKMVVELEPNAKQEFILPAGVQTAVVIDFPLDSKPIERIHVLFSTETPESMVYMRGWTIDTLTVGFISHATIAKVSGHSVWASSGVMAKPFFLKLDYIKAQADLLAKLDAGLIAL